LAVLMESANRHPNILREPKPLATFDGYTPLTTEYTLRVLLPDITSSLRVQSDLRIAIYEAFRRSGIVSRDVFAPPAAVGPEAEGGAGSEPMPAPEPAPTTVA
jgi:potassium-dependent mechanosensitive channel